MPQSGATEDYPSPEASDSAAMTNELDIYMCPVPLSHSLTGAAPENMPWEVCSTLVQGPSPRNLAKDRIILGVRDTTVNKTEFSWNSYPRSEKGGGERNRNKRKYHTSGSDKKL